MLQKSKQRKSGFTLSSSKGFTIIEVLIVLAIAGLILLIVFLAVPNLERNSRNTQRKNDVQSILGAVSEYESNNAGSLPATGADSATLSGSTLTIGASGAAQATANLGYYNTSGAVSIVPCGATSVGSSCSGLTAPDTDHVEIVEGAACGTDNTPVGASARSIAAYYKIENAIQCTSS